MNFSKEKVASILRGNRAMRRMSRDDLSNATGIPATTIGSYENAESVMNLENACKFADVFELGLDELVGRTR